MIRPRGMGGKVGLFLCNLEMLVYAHYAIKTDEAPWSMETCSGCDRAQLIACTMLMMLQVGQMT